MDNKLRSLNHIFTNRVFRIPDYQRGYSWGTAQLEDFWQDLLNIKDHKIHYTGLLTVEAVSYKEALQKEQWQNDLWMIEEDADSTAYYVIDGQQRLTTSIILINEILSKLTEDQSINNKAKSYWVDKFLYQSVGEGYQSYLFGYERDNPSDEYFKTKILNQKSMSADKVAERTLYTSNLTTAKEFFIEHLNSLEFVELEKLFKRLINKFRFNFYEIDDELDVFVTFETMNNRGKPLSNLELLKNRLIYLSTLLETDEVSRQRLRQNINEAWKTVYEYLGRNEKRRMPDDDFLKNHWIMYYKYDRKESNVYAKFLLNKVFTPDRANSGELKAPEIQAYLDSLAKAVKSWFFMHNPELSDYSVETKEWLQKLNRIGMAAFPPLLMAIMMREKEPKVLNFIKAAERFVFLVFRVSQRPSHTKNSDFFRLANQFYKGEEGLTVSEVTSKVATLTDGEWGEGDNYEYYGWCDLDRFKGHIEDLFKRGKGYYGWNSITYFLYEYEQSLESQSGGDTKLFWKSLANRKREDSIEHIFPQTPNKECWEDHYGQFKEKQQRYLLNSLGNLVLLKRKKNSELSNRCFSDKIRYDSKDGERGYFNGSYSEIEIASYDDWTPAEINGRGIQLLKFLEERWGVSFEEWNIEYKEMLQLGFLYNENGDQS